MRSIRHYLHVSPQFLLRLSLIIGLMLISAALSFKASQRQMILILMMPFGVGMVLAFMRWPSLGILIGSLSGLVVPFLGPSGLNTTMILLALMLGLWLMDMIVRQQQIRIAPSRTVWPLLAFVIASLFSFGIGQLPWLTFALHAPLGAQLGGLSVVVLSVCTFLLMSNQLRDLRWLRAITYAFIVVAGLSVIFRSALPSLGFPQVRLFQQVGTMFYVCLIGVTFSQAAFNTDLHRGWRWALGGLVVVTIYVLFFLKFADKSGWLSSFVCIAAILAARSWRVGLAMVPVGILVFLVFWARLVGADDYSISTRFDAWLILAQIVKSSPLLGLGFANYYWYTPLFPIRGYAVSFNSHNNFVDIVAQTGLIGLACFVWILWEIGWLGWQLREQVPAGFARAYVYGALGILAGMAVAGMLGDWVLPFFYNIGLNGFRSSVFGWLFLGGLVSLEQMVIRQKFTAGQP